MGYTEKCRREAFESVPMSKMESKVYGVLAEFGKMSPEQIMEKLNISNPNSVRPRLTGLSKKRLIKEVGVRMNKNGYNETVWEIAV